MRKEVAKVIFQWIVGLLIAVGRGHYATKYFLGWLRGEMNNGEKPMFDEGSEWKRVTPWVTGVVERAFFAVAVGLGMSGAVGAMMGWLALKLATSWNHPDWKDEPRARSFAFSALLAGVVSMFFAVVGGSICAV